MRLFALSFVLLLVSSACSQRLPETRAFVPDADATAMVALADGGLRYGDGQGQVWDVTVDGRRVEAPLGVAPGPVSALVADPGGRTFVAQGSQVVELSSGRVVWRGSEPVGTVLTFTPGGRLLVSSSAGLLSLDPDGAADQRPNEVSKNWQDIGGAVYAAGQSLWVAGVVQSGEEELIRADVDGPTGTAADLSDGAPRGLTTFGDQELVACEGSGTLRRFLLTNAMARPGRVVAEDCIGDVIELADGRLAYIAAAGSIRTTAQ